MTSPPDSPPMGAGEGRPLAIDYRSILSLAWPVILTNLLTTAVSWIDLLMVSRLGKDTIAAVGLAGFLMTLLWVILMSVQAGTSIVVAQAYGAGDRQRIERCVWQALILGGLTAGAVTLVLCWPGSDLLLRAFLAFDVEPAVADIGARYLRIVLLVLAGLLVSLVGQTALRSTGDTRTPLWLTGASNLVNIVLNYALIFGKLGMPELGVEGAAWGTVVARGTEAVAYLVLLSRGRLRVHLARRSLRLDLGIVRDLMRLGIPAGAEQLVFNTGLLIYTRVIASYGTDSLAAYQIGVVLLQASFMPGFGFSVAATTLVGQWTGAGDSARARSAGRRCRRLAVWLMSALGALFLVAARPFSRLIIDDAAVVDLATLFIRLLALSQPAMAIHFALSGALRGAGDVRSPLLGAIAGMYGVRIPMSLFTTFVLGAPVLWPWLGMVGAHAARALVLQWRWNREFPRDQPLDPLNRA